MDNQKFTNRAVDKLPVKKGKEYTFTVRVPSRIGELSYLLVAKAKKTINE